LIIKKLQVENLRNLSQVRLRPHPRLNLVHGDNGAGKTSLLESLVVLSRGRSFRTNQAGELIGPDQKTFRIFAEACDRNGKELKLGLERSGKRWRGRINGRDLSQLSQLTQSLPLVLMEPDSHLLISGPPETRRKFLDWGMFHGEQGFLDTWRRFSTALKQRNAALRRRQTDVLDSLDQVLSEQGEQLSALRRRYCERIASSLLPMLSEMSDGLDAVSLSYRAGWKGDCLLAALINARESDLERGLTGAGPHRADLALVCGSAPARAKLSRGEQKLLSAALILSQADLLVSEGRVPLMLLDDLASEFDGDHFERTLSRALDIGGQVWLTGTSRPELEREHRVFHVEQGRVSEVV
jgi:DNA replication and repair protein RecF